MYEDTIQEIQNACYQLVNLCSDPVGNKDEMMSQVDHIKDALDALEEE